MGHMKRAEAREQARREAGIEVRRIVITWKQRDGKVYVNFLDSVTKEPLTRCRIYASVEPVRGFVSRSMTVLVGQRRTDYTAALLKGFGEIEVEITSVQFDRLTLS